MTKVNEFPAYGKRAVETGDNMGGSSVLMSDIAGSPLTCRLARAKDYTNVSGLPGRNYRDFVTLIFAPGADVENEDVWTVDGRDYRVKGLRKYARSLQADCETLS